MHDFKSSDGLLKDSLVHMRQIISQNTKLHTGGLKRHKLQVFPLQPTLTSETVIPNSYSVAMTHLDSNNHDKTYSFHLRISHSRGTCPTPSCQVLEQTAAHQLAATGKTGQGCPIKCTLFSSKRGNTVLQWAVNEECSSCSEPWHLKCHMLQVN
jgi:hypothetical protein